MEDMEQKMDRDMIFVKKASELKQVIAPGKLYRLLIKSKKMEAIISELEPHAESRWYQHDGEEIHYMIQGEMDYKIGQTVHHLKEGDILWHISTIKHKAKNTTGEKISYITVGSPPTFL
jgi:quercetin dioxygenase-like cupin family protein